MSRYFDMEGNPTTMIEWAKSGIRHIGNDTVGDVTVSTVHLGLDHNWGEGPPLIFETMIFGGDHDQEQWRYSTREQAEEGHRAACELAFGHASTTGDRSAVVSESDPA